jgi:hypothetical protein
VTAFFSFVLDLPRFQQRAEVGGHPKGHDAADPSRNFGV